MTDPRDDAIASMRAARATPGEGGGVPVAAATVVLVRPGPDGPEILLTRRPSTMAFAANVHVFPGGRVDPSDADPANALARGLSPDAAATRLAGTLEPAAAIAHHVAAVRETLEETGIRIDIGDLVPMTRWVTPESMPRRFDVRFFAAIVPAGTDIVTPSPEVAASRWITADQALREAAAGTLAMLLPTIASFEQLRGQVDRAAIEAAFEPGTDVGPPTIGLEEDGLATVGQCWAGGIAGRSTPAWLVGRREVVLVDAADPTGETMAAIEAGMAERGARIVGVAITSIAPECAAGVELYAAGRGLPVVGGAGGSTPYPRIILAPEDAVPFGDVQLVAEAPDGTAVGSLAYRLADGRRLPPRLAGRGSERREA
ncbi:MAG: NUDIX domain-containing protein [Chloroflexota bacterium]